MIEIEMGLEGLGNSHQDPFPEVTECVHCKKEAKVVFTAIEFVDGHNVQPLITRLYPDAWGAWVHDLSSWAIYLCPSCMGATTLWNQL